MGRYFAAWADTEMFEHAAKAGDGLEPGPVICAKVYDLDGDSRIGDTYRLNWTKSEGWFSLNPTEVIAKWHEYLALAKHDQELGGNGRYSWAECADVFQAIIDLMVDHPLHSNWWKMPADRKDF